MIEVPAIDQIGFDIRRRVDDAARVDRSAKSLQKMQDLS
jgi:hypothetical protein